MGELGGGEERGTRVHQNTGGHLRRGNSLAGLQEKFANVLVGTRPQLRGGWTPSDPSPRAFVPSPCCPQLCQPSPARGGAGLCHCLVPRCCSWPTQPPHPVFPPVPGHTLSRLLRSGQSSHWEKHIPHGCRDNPLQWQRPALPGRAGPGAGRDVGQGSCCSWEAPRGLLPVSPTCRVCSEVTSHPCAPSPATA